jgi:hypothetical protein
MAVRERKERRERRERGRSPPPLGGSIFSRKPNERADRAAGPGSEFESGRRGGSIGGGGGGGGWERGRADRTDEGSRGVQRRRVRVFLADKRKGRTRARFETTRDAIILRPRTTSSPPARAIPRGMNSYRIIELLNALYFQQR